MPTILAAITLLTLAYSLSANTLYSLSAHGSDAQDLQNEFEVLPADNQTGWLGGDSDVSVVIAGGPSGRRALWIFADTFVARFNSRTQSREWADMRMPCSSVALVDCPSADSAAGCAGRPRFYWREEDPRAGVGGGGAVAPFFDLPAEQKASGGELLLWVVAGIASRDGRSVLLLAQRIRRPLTVLGSTMIVITGVDQETDPRNWNYTTSELGDSEMTWFSGITFAADEGDEVYLFGHAHEGGPRSFSGRRSRKPETWSPTLLARASLFNLLQHDWSSAEYWSEPGVWAPAWPPHARGTARPTELPSWETTCTWSAGLQLWYAFNVEGPSVALWTAEQVIGPWRRSAEVYHLPRPFAGNSTWLCYAAKAHPELVGRRGGDGGAAGKAGVAGAAELVFSWICNFWGTEDTARAELFQPGGMAPAIRGYWPRFARVAVAARRPITIHIA